jgi:hypothetical protein
MWIHAALVGAILMASGAPVVAQEEEDGPVPPVYVPEEEQIRSKNARDRTARLNLSKRASERPGPSRGVVASAFNSQ